MRHLKRITIALLINLLLVILLLSGDLLVTSAQQQELPPPPPPPQEKPKDKAKRADQNDDDIIKTDVNLVTLDVSVLDKNNKFIQNLGQNRFQIFEDQIAQKIEFFSQEQVPISYGIVVDTSGSMRKRLPTVIKAAKSLISLGKQGDEVFIVDMKDSQNIELMEDFTTSADEANEALDNMIAGGGTALLDGIVVSGEYARKGKNRRKALVIISDGDERDSTFSIEQTLDKLREFDVQVYLIGFTDELGEDSGIFKKSPKKKATDLITKLATESGGQAYFPRDLADLEPIAQKIGSDLRSQYSIGYTPSNEKRDGTFRKIQVKLMDNKDQYAVRTRAGYYATKDGLAVNSNTPPKRTGHKN